MPWAPSTPPHRRLGGSQRSEATRRPVGECGEMWASRRQSGRLRPETGRTAKKTGRGLPKNWAAPSELGWASYGIRLGWALDWAGRRPVGAAFIWRPPSFATRIAQALHGCSGCTFVI